MHAVVCEHAGRLGFCRTGFAALGASRTYERFGDWLACGHAAGMAYLRRHAALRADPRALAPWAKSVIVVAARYPSNPVPGSGISTYARGADYHDVLRAKLGRLAGALRECAGRPVRTRICVDSAPLLEREWAVRAGIGWRGRQNSIVNREFGCCLVLGEILVDLALPPAREIPDGCGNCRRCVDACPTGALGEDGFVDARRCRSYLTVEHQGAIPRELQPPLGAALFGCDCCTAVCPWNANGEEAVMPELREPPAGTPDAHAILAFSEADFERRFAGTAVCRTGLARLKRNARIALGNSVARDADAAET